MKKEFYLELWLSVFAFGCLLILLVLGWIIFALIAGFIFQMNDPLSFRLVMGGFTVFLLVPMTYGILGCQKHFRSRRDYRHNFVPTITDVRESATLTAAVTFYGNWPKVGEYHDCVLSFSSGKGTLTRRPRFVSSRALDAIATTVTPGQVMWEGEMFFREGEPYLFRDESFRLWF